MEPNNDTKQHVYVFGEKVGEQAPAEGVQEEKEMPIGDHRDKKGERRRVREYHDGGGVIFGFLLLFAGIVLILNNFGVVSWIFWYAIAPLWPLLLVLLGLRIIFGHSRASRVITALFAILFGAVVIAYGLIRINSPLSNRVPTGLRNSVETIRIIQIHR